MRKNDHDAKFNITKSIRRKRGQFLESELALSLTFSLLAAMKFEDGDQQSAKTYIVNADEAASTVFQFLSNPKLYERLTDKALCELIVEAERVKQRLEVIRRNGTNRNAV